ncbi:ubxn-3 [Pristionchus pacificus]|uniref:Ubxn-3 n=1 Tax=Pristionchus pacificus TaxID=54126 RepID=A0A2A6B677_PRIPA|nr:ubxn-3 [Pristionchus pacificus]|eukprot:PDM61389.1 ubxn-3 [Pristionchus pacificus]
MDMDQLSDEQMNKLRQFQDIANLDEMDLAVVTLASCDWNLEHAIEAHLGGNPPVHRAPQLGINHLDYAPDFDGEAMMVDADEEFAPQLPPPRRAAATTRAATAAAAAASDDSMASGSSRSRAAAVAQTPAAPVHTKVEEKVSTSGKSVSTSSKSTSGIVVTPTAAAAAAEVDVVVPAAPAARAAAGYSSAEVLASNGGSARRGGGSDFGVPLIPTDCASALEGTQNFQSVFEARYGKDGRGHLMPPFFIGTLQSAISEAFNCPDRPVSERRPLALYIHHDRSVARNIFPQAVLCNDGVLGLLRSQFIVWPWDVTAKQNEDKLTAWLSECSLYDTRPIVASFLNNVDRFPLLILLSKDGGQLRMIDFVNGSEGADQAMEKLLMCMDAYATSKISLEKQETERQERELLRREQERELQESLAVDRERAERQAREIREAKEAEERVAREREEREAHIAALKSSLPEEPAAGTKGCCSVRFRLPERGIVDRRFSKSSPFSVVLTFLESEGFPVADYRFMNSDFPQKKDVSAWEPKSTLEELKFPEREVINVEER